MNSTMPDPRSARRRLRVRAGQLCVAALLLVAAVGCNSKTPAQLAVDELNAGLAASGQGQTEQAATHYKACLQHDSLNQFCIYNLGVIAQQAGRAAEAENNYRLALLIDPKFESAWSNLGILRAGTGANDEAITIFRQVIAINKDNAFAHLNLGLLLRAKGETVEAKKELARAVQLDPNVVIPSFEPSATPTPPLPSPSPSSSERASPTPA
jgi:tetratricopeptide (TPR) repeat protein